MGRMSLPPGFRFHPTDNELIMYYLKRKVAGKKLHYDAITELDIYMFCPWDLPDKCLLKSKDLEWYFFSPSKKKYGRGARTNRATENGYWKATGKDRPVIYKQRTVGMIKTLIFHTGHAPKGERTDWVMHEYRLEDESIADVVQDSYRLCKIFQKSGLGPQIGAHYGAPFNEEEWSDAEEICVESLLVASQILPDCVLPSNKSSSDEVTLNIPGNSPQRSTSEPDQSTDRSLDINMNTDTEKINVEPLSIDAQVLYNYVPPIDVGSSAAMNMTVLGNSSGWRASKSGPSTAGPPVMDIPCSSDLPYEDFDALLDMFIEDSYMPMNNCDEKFENNGSLPCLDENGIYNGLGDLNDWVVPKETGFNVSSTPDAAFHLNAMLLSDDVPFLELDDLETPLRCPAETGEFNTSQTQDAAYNLNPVLLCDDTPYLELEDLNTPFRCPAETGQCERTHTDSIYAAYTHDRSMGINGSYSDNLSSLVNVSGWSGPSVLLQGSDMLGNNLDDLGRDNCISNFEAHDYDVATCIEVPFSRREPEGSSIADQIQRRGEWHTNLQLLLESVSAQLAELLAHMIRAKQLNDSFPHIGSSIHFKAEVTLKFCECTKDALLHNMEESPSVFLCWDYLPTREMKNRMPTSSFVFSYNLDIDMVWILMTKYHIFFDLSCSFEWSGCSF